MFLFNSFVDVLFAAVALGADTARVRTFPCGRLTEGYTDDSTNSQAYIVAFVIKNLNLCFTFDSF